MKIGDEFRSRIDAAIHVHDRLLLILSEHSVKSHWVQKEVETAFEKEAKENRLVLFPIRLDEAVMQIDVGLGCRYTTTAPYRRLHSVERARRVSEAFARLLRISKPQRGSHKVNPRYLDIAPGVQEYLVMVSRNPLRLLRTVREGNRGFTCLAERFIV